MYRANYLYFWGKAPSRLFLVFFLKIRYTALEVIAVKFQSEPGRIYAVDSAGTLLAEVTFPTIDAVAVINHTFVDSSLRGKGVADQLLTAAVMQIRAQGHKARPTCSYAVQWFEKHPEHSDLL